jgi:hypothetical protein
MDGGGANEATSTVTSVEFSKAVDLLGIFFEDAFA